LGEEIDDGHGREEKELTVVEGEARGGGDGCGGHGSSSGGCSWERGEGGRRSRKKKETEVNGVQ